MKSVIFLDVDGVLHILGDRAGVMNRGCVTALNWLTAKTGARIVVSSTWRLYGDRAVASKIRRLLQAQGIGAKIIGVTPYTPIQTDESRIVLAKTRGEEINAWLSSHHPMWDQFIVLDDERGGMDGLEDRLVQTTFERGLTMDLAEEAALLLG